MLKRIKFTPDEIVDGVFAADEAAGVCILDSCGATHQGSEWLIAGIAPQRRYKVLNEAPSNTLELINNLFTGSLAVIFTISYDFGRKLEGIGGISQTNEPDFFAASFDCLLLHNYRSAETFLAGNERRFEGIERAMADTAGCHESAAAVSANKVFSNFSRERYVETIERIKEFIRRGDTYQTNLTQQLTLELETTFSSRDVFQRIRKQHPSPYSAFVQRADSTVISASPERFFRVTDDRLVASPIKGTRPRGVNASEDQRLRDELLNSQKDRAENIMIVDLLRNDLGRVCQYGTVKVRELCEIQELPTLFHLVSTVEGRLRFGIKPSEIIRALFPCGSITGAPKIRTMEIIDRLEGVDRGLSMGAIGIYIPDGFGVPPVLDLCVAIRTMLVKDNVASFNVGGGIVIDSDPEAEYEESLLKARSLLMSLGIETVTFEMDPRAGNIFLSRPSNPQ